MVDADFAESDLFPYEVYVELNVFHMLVVHRITRHVNGQDVVTEHHCFLVNIPVQLAEEVPEP